MGSSFKSNRSGATQEKELNLLEHVDNAFNAVASSLGGLFGSPKNNANDNKIEEGKSFATDENTMAQSTLPSEAPTEQSDDWFGYMERVLFPTKEETQKVSCNAIPYIFHCPYSSHRRHLHPLVL
jgi:hypothetical protein